MTEMVNRFCKSFLVESVFLMIMGILLIIMPGFSTVTLSFLISVSLMVVGIYKLINSIVRRDEVEKFWLQMIIALLLIVTGIYMTIYPFYNLFVLTMGVALYFILESINSIYLTFENRGIVRYWWTGFFMAAVQLFLGIFILLSLPFSSLWLLGTLLGISFLINGILTIVMFTSSKMIESEQ